MADTQRTRGRSPVAPSEPTGRFVPEELVGSGGMGAVFRAKDRQTGATVALKLLTAEESWAKDRFRQEAEVLAALDHPGIVKYVAHGTTEKGQLFLAMEWLLGEDLEARLARQSLTVAESVTLATRVAEALGAAHELGIVHRDIKPSNLLLVGRDVAQVKVLDFGIAREGGSRRITSHGGVVGTLGYMAPEQARGAPDIDARADVFSLGCVLFECVTGRPAFAGEHALAVLTKILLEEAPRLRTAAGEVPVALDALVARMLSKNREARPQGGAELVAELLSLDDRQTSAPPSRGAPQSLTRAEQRLLCVILAGRAADPEGPPTPTVVGTCAVAAATEDTLYDVPVVDAVDADLDAAVLPFDARVERLIDGSVLATVTGRVGARDQCGRAAGCALVLRALYPDLPMALATGRGEVGGHLPVGEVIDRAAGLVREARARTQGPHGIRLDDVTAGLLDARFELASVGDGLALIREREPIDTTRTLLGKATPCVGRERELALLAATFEQCVAEASARVVLLTAPAGVGKSRLRHELFKLLGDRVDVWSGRGDPTSAGAPFAMIAPVLRRAAGLLGGEPPEARARKLAVRVARHVKPQEQHRVTTFLGELIGAPLPAPENPHLRAARRDAIVMAEQTRRAFATFLRAESEATPVLIVLDDLHWGDLPSVALLDAALRDVKERPWMILALARPQVHTVFPDLWAGRGLVHVELGYLSARASEKLVREVLGSDTPEATVERVVSHAGGNAFYLEELIRAVAEGKGDALPGTVLAMVQARLEALDPEARRVLRAASVFGQVFWGGAVARLLGVAPPGLQVSARIAELVGKELVTELSTTTFPGEREYGFRHAVVREAAYATLTETDRVLGHELAGDWLEASGETDALIVANHFERGGNGARAIEWYRLAAEEALAANDFDAAIASAARGIGCGATGETRGALHMVRSEAHAWKSEHAPSLADAVSATGAFARATDAWFSAIGRAALECRRLGRTEEATRWAEALLESWPEASGSAAAIVAACHAAETVLFIGNHALGDRLVERIERELAASGSTEGAVVGHVHRTRATRGHLVGKDPSVHVTWLASSAAAFEACGDFRNACIGRANRGFGLLVLGDYEESERELRAAREVAAHLGLLTLVAVCEHNLGAALGRRGDVERGLHAERAAVATFCKHGDLRLEAASRAYLAELLLDAGDTASAHAEARLAVERASAIPPTRAQALGILARIHLARGAPRDALGAAREAHALLERLGALESWTELIRLVLAEALEAAGDHAAAASAIADARDRLLERAARVGSPAARATFLDVRECARTLALAKAWCGEG